MVTGVTGDDITERLPGFQLRMEAMVKLLMLLVMVVPHDYVEGQTFDAVMKKMSSVSAAIRTGIESSREYHNTEVNVHRDVVRIGDIVEGTWYFIEESRETGRCPSKITHGRSTRPGGGTIGVPHYKIMHDDVQCVRGANMHEANENLLVYYRSNYYTPKLEPRRDASELPMPLKEILSDSRFAKKTLSALYKSQDVFLFGYEQRDRKCGTRRKGLFKERTTSFVVEPKTGGVRVRGLSTQLSAGTRWMVMIPRFRNLSCLYSAEDVKESQGESETMVPSGEHGNSDPQCFPGSATARLEDGRVVRMDALRTGQRVATGNGRIGLVYGFSHRAAGVVTKFVEVVLRCGRSVRLSHGHLVYTDKGIRKASEIEKGDTLFIENGQTSLVVRLSMVSDTGLYNPQTDVGDIEVNGIRVTTYTSGLDLQTAHAALAPFRALFRACGLSGVSIVTDCLRDVPLVRGRLSVAKRGMWAVARDVWSRQPG